MKINCFFLWKLSVFIDRTDSATFEIDKTFLSISLGKYVSQIQLPLLFFLVLMGISLLTFSLI